MKRPGHCLVILLLLGLTPTPCPAQEYGPPDRGAPGDEMIQAWLASQANRIHAAFTNDLQSLESWRAGRPGYLEEYLHMLGLAPLPERTPLEATVTGTLEGEGYVVEMIHYQSRPRLYVTGNLYRPARMAPGQRLPAVFCVCGHSYQGRSGNKTAYQSHGIWFARHGYVCLVVDTLQLGEIAGVHHGTYREARWWWHSRGYTPAGVECWNGIRGIDYLVSRPDVDPDRIAVTGISGGGAATFWIAAADERVTVAVPVSGMADLPSYVNNRVVNGHCDCMFLYNTYQWPWTRIAALIAPRPLLFANSDQDRIFPMDANERVIGRLERLYSLYGRSDFVDAMVSIGGHAYRRDLRQAAYRFINTHLDHNPRQVDDSEQDLITGQGDNRQYPIPIDQLRVFPTDADLPADELNSTIDQHFVPMARVAVPEPAQFDSWREALRSELRRVTFRAFPEPIPPGRFPSSDSSSHLELETEPGIVIRLVDLSTSTPPDRPERILLGVGEAEAAPAFLDYLRGLKRPGDLVCLCEARGLGVTRWTRENPPNYVARSHVLLGQTVDTGRVRDILATVRALRQRHADPPPVTLVGSGAAAVLAAYAALWEPDIDRLILRNPMLTHMDADAPQFLNVLRVCDVPEVLGMLAPRALVIDGAPAGGALAKTVGIYRAAGAADKLQIKP